MKRISLLVIIPLSLLMISCTPIPEGRGYNAPYGEEQMGPAYPNFMDREGGPYFFYEGTPSPSFHGHDHDRDSHRDNDRDHDRDHDGAYNRDGLRDFGRDRK